MVLKAYFDAGNQGDSRQYDVLSLAVVNGTMSVWKPFERAWKLVLRRHKTDFLHTTDAVSRRGIYEGWDEKRRDLFLKDCVDVAAKHCARITTGNIPGAYGIYIFVVSFDLKDFVAFDNNNLSSPQNVYEGCVRQTIPAVIDWAENQASSDQVHLFFDQGKPYYGILVNLLRNKKALREAHGLARVTD